MKALVLKLRIPPSANRMTKLNRRTGRIYTSPEYNAWKIDALSLMWTQKPAGGFPFFAGKFRAEIVLPIKLRIDEDNAVKPLLDFLQKPGGIVANDKNVRGHTVERSDEIDEGFCRIAIYDLAEAA